MPSVSAKKNNLLRMIGPPIWAAYWLETAFWRGVPFRLLKKSFAFSPSLL